LALVVTLERALPPRLPAGRATAVFCGGVCFDATRRIERLEILVDGAAHAASAFGMPRPDVAAAYADSAAAANSRHSGFWATVSVPGHAAPGEIVVQVAAHLAEGASEIAELGRIEVVAPEPAAPIRARPARPGDGVIAVCRATFEPQLDLLKAQIESLRAQTDEHWICLVSDDGSSVQKFEHIVELIGADPRFEVSRSPQRQGFYRNFERVLQMVPVDAPLVALSDQDDRWYPDKLRTLRGSIGSAGLVYSDQRLVDARGAVLRETLWRGRRNNHDDLTSMLVANTITGAATLFRRELLDVLLPFPDTPGFQFHDAWLGATALAAGVVAYVDRPLYDYVQHADAVFGDVTHGRGRRGGRGDRSLAASRAAYFHGYLGREAQAQVLLARCGPQLTRSKRRALERLVACDRSPAALAWLALRALRCLTGRNETLGSELGLARGVAWKLATSTLARRAGLLTERGPFADASIPAPERFNQKRLRRWRARI
jgi:hypothetical protein